jgi:hypothetical protein
MQITIYTETIWPSIHAALLHFQQERKGGLPTDVLAGINFSIILGSACYLEGVLETGLKALLAHRRYSLEKPRGSVQERRAFNAFYYGVTDDLERRICNATGTDGYDPLFELLTGMRLSKLSAVVPLWEGITVLFQMRNVLGHGRAVTAKRVNAYQMAVQDEEKFAGGYRRAEDYLRKRKLLDKKFTEAHSEYIFLSDKIADHFLDLARQTPKAISKSLDSIESRVFQQAVFS